MHRRSHPCRRIYSRRDAGILRRRSHCLRKSVCPRTLPVHEKALQHCSSGQPLRRQRSKRTTPRRMETDSIQLSFQHILFRPVSDNLPCQIHTRCAAGIPYEHIIILANTEEYGGGGIYNSYTLTTAHHPMFRPVVYMSSGIALADWPMNTSTTMT